MSLWNKLLDRSEAEPASEPAAPVRVELIAGKLAAQVTQHEIKSPQGAISCWSYVTEGLIAQHQAELVFTLRRDPGEPSFPQDPLQLFVTVYHLAERGQRVVSGSITQFGERRFFGQHLVYVGAQPMAGVSLPPSCLAAVLVSDDELRAARELGSTRVLARMGQASSHYPFPPWADRRRRGLSLERTFEATLLSKIHRASAHGLHVGMIDDRIVVTALRSEQPAWHDRLAQLPDGAPFAFLTSLDPAANGCLVWVPGQTQPEAITPPGSDGSRVCGCFLVIIAGQPNNGGKILEDGFAMELTGDAWQAIRRALVDGKALSIPASGPASSGLMPLVLAWRDEVHVSPIDGRGHTAEGGSTSDAPGAAGDAPLTDGRVAIGQLRLVTSQDELAARTTANDLAVFCRELQRCTARVLGDRGGQLALRLQVTCTAQGHQLVLARQGEASDQTLQALVDALQAVPTLPLGFGEVRFELDLMVAAAGSP
jgi:hypothetical protein